jgi:hypothetical protein
VGRTPQGCHSERGEYDLQGGVRGKYCKQYMKGTNVVLLDPDVAAVCRDSECDPEVATAHSPLELTAGSSSMEKPTVTKAVAVASTKKRLTCTVLPYILEGWKDNMQLVRFRHKGLRQLPEDGNAQGVPSAMADKLRKLLFALETAETLEQPDPVSRLEAAPS